MNLNVSEISPMFQESPISLVAGETTTIAVRWWGTPTTVSTVVYKVTAAGETDVTATVMPSGSVTISGSTSTLKPLVLAAANGGYQHVLVMTGTVNSDVKLRKLLINVQTASGA